MTKQMTIVATGSLRIESLNLNKSILLPMKVFKIAGQVEYGIDPDQNLYFAVSDLDLQCLLRTFCSNS